MKTKPFDLEKAKAGHKVCTRDGRPARIICWDYSHNMPIVAIITEADGNDILTYTNKGAFVQCEETCHDLMLAVETVKKEGWVNMYDDGIRHHCATVYGTKEEALNSIEAGADYIDSIKIEWEEEV